MKTPLVLFRSHYGSTLQYAEWLAESLSCPCYDVRRIPKDALSTHDSIVFGGGLYAGKIAGASTLLRETEVLLKKRLVVFTVGASDPTDTSKYTQLIEKTFPPALRLQTAFFHLRGNLVYSKMSFQHRAMMKLLKKMVEKMPPDQRSQEDQDILSTFGVDTHFTDRNSLAPILSCIKGL
jgi:menaquinone-dependent protoporphyrinogen IX oxidase